MKKFFISNVLLLIYFNVYPQSYQPVHADGFYNMQDGTGNIHHLEVENVIQDGQDSLFYFNSICRPRSPGQSMDNCGFDQVEVLYDCDEENLWGSYMRKLPGGEYEFTTLDSEIFYLPVNNLNTSFDFYTSPTAMITGQYQTTLPPAAPYPNDSIRVFALSNSQQILVLENHGILNAFDFMRLSDAGPVATDVVRAETILPTGQFEYRGVHEFYDYLPGDVKVMHNRSYDSNSFIYYESWDVDSVIAVLVGQNTTTVSHQRRSLVHQMPTPFSSLDTIYWTAPTVQTTTYENFAGLSLVHYPLLGMLLRSGPGIHFTGNYSQEYNRTWELDTCGFLSPAIDYGVTEIYTAPFGLTKRETQSFGYDISEMVCFTRGSQLWGTCPNFGTILSQEQPQRISLEVFPNPGDEALRVAVEGNSLITVSLFDLSGNLVLPVVNGSAEVELITADLPDGVFFLKVFSDGEYYHQPWIKSSR